MKKLFYLIIGLLIVTNVYCVNQCGETYKKVKRIETQGITHTDGDSLVYEIKVCEQHSFYYFNEDGVCNRIQSLMSEDEGFNYLQFLKKNRKVKQLNNCEYIYSTKKYKVHIQYIKIGNNYLFKENLLP